MRRLRPRVATLALVLVVLSVCWAAAAMAAGRHADPLCPGCRVWASFTATGITLSTSRVPHGQVVIIVRADTHAHRFVLLRTHLPAGGLPLKGTVVDLSNAGQLLRALTVPGGTVRRLTLALTAGRYVFLCNDPGCYQAGHYATLSVT